jgi:hypothetical protein
VLTGVVSGVKEYRPGIILDKRESGLPRGPIAFIGKAYCKVDAQWTHPGRRSADHFTNARTRHESG